MSTKFGILKPWTNIAWLKRFDYGFWQTSKEIYRKLEYKEKAFVEFLNLPRFPRKKILHTLIKFGILKPWTNTACPRCLELGFWQTSEEIYRKIQYREKLLESLTFTLCLIFPKKSSCICQPSLAFYSLEPIFHDEEDSI